MLINKLAHLEDIDRLLFYNKLKRHGISVDEPIFRVLILRASDKRSGWHKELHPMFQGDICDLVNGSVARHDWARFYFLHLL